MVDDASQLVPCDIFRLVHHNLVHLYYKKTIAWQQDRENTACGVWETQPMTTKIASYFGDVSVILFFADTVLNCKSHLYTDTQIEHLGLDSI